MLSKPLFVRLEFYKFLMHILLHKYAWNFLKENFIKEKYCFFRCKIYSHFFQGRGNKKEGSFAEFWRSSRPFFSFGGVAAYLFFYTFGIRFESAGGEEGSVVVISTTVGDQDCTASRRVVRP